MSREFPLRHLDGRIPRIIHMFDRHPAMVDYVTDLYQLSPNMSNAAEFTRFNFSEEEPRDLLEGVPDGPPKTN